MYSTEPGQAITITTYGGGDKQYKLRGRKDTPLTELSGTDFFRHLGNIQNADGMCKASTVQMYDGSEQENILVKVTKGMAALNSRNLTPGGVMQAIKTVVIRQILYPTTYANMDEI